MSRIYVKPMRTTILINDTLAESAKEYAVRHGRSLSGLIDEALRERLAKGEKSDESVLFSMPVFGSRGERHQSSPADFNRLMEDDDFENL